MESYFHDMTNEEYALAGIRNCELVEYHLIESHGKCSASLWA